MIDEKAKQEAENYLDQAKLHNKKGATAQAVAAYQTADKIFIEYSDERGRTVCWSGIAKAYGKSKELDRAVAAFAEAARHAVLADWPDKEIEVLYNMGLTLQQMGTKGANLKQVGQAIDAFKQGLATAERIGDKQSEGVLLLSLGFACAWSNRDEEGIEYFDRAASFALQGIDFDTAFSALSSLGVMLSNNGRPAEAIPHYERALELSKTQEGDIVAVADTYANLGIAYEKAGHLEKAIEAMEIYSEILQHAGDVKAADAKAMVKRLKIKGKLK